MRKRTGARREVIHFNQLEASCIYCCCCSSSIAGETFHLPAKLNAAHARTTLTCNNSCAYYTNNFALFLRPSFLRNPASRKREERRNRSRKNCHCRGMHRDLFPFYSFLFRISKISKRVCARVCVKKITSPINLILARYRMTQRTRRRGACSWGEPPQGDA